MNIMYPNISNYHWLIEWDLICQTKINIVNLYFIHCYDPRMNYKTHHAVSSFSMECLQCSGLPITITLKLLSTLSNTVHQFNERQRYLI